ncbi:MAG TPA: hypothetical protein VF003_18340 [Pseudonocardiaceae bacterium]
MATTVAQVMTRDPVTVSAAALIREAARQMWAKTLVMCSSWTTID